MQKDSPTPIEIVDDDGAATSPRSTPSWSRSPERAVGGDPDQRLQPEPGRRAAGRPRPEHQLAGQRGQAGRPARRGAPGRGHPGGQGGRPGRRLPRRRHDDRGRGRRPVHRPRARRVRHPRPPDRGRADDLRPAADWSDRAPMDAARVDVVVVAAGVQPADGRRRQARGADRRPAAARLDARARSRPRREVARIVVVTARRPGRRDARGATGCRRRWSTWSPAATDARSRSRPASRGWPAEPGGAGPIAADPRPRRRPPAGRAGRARRRGRRRRRRARRGDPGPAAGRDGQADRRRQVVERPSTATTSATAQTPQGVRRDLLERAYAAFPAAGRADLHRRGRPAGGLYHSRPCGPRRSDEPQGDRARGSRTGPRPRCSERCAARRPGIRVGFGSDGHPFGPGEPLALGGIAIDGAPRLHGHSDGDVALHAVADALLGPAALGDLGRLFPADPRRRAGIASGELLASRRRAGSRTRAIAPRPIDLTIVGARPRLGGRLDAMRVTIAGLARASTLDPGQRQGIDRQPRRARRAPAGASSARVVGGRRVARARPDDPPPARHAQRPQRELSCRSSPAMSGSTRCGPTVYGPAHIGNFRSFLFADLLVRYLRYRGLRVTWVMNITDIDDKIIGGAAAAGDLDRRARPSAGPSAFLLDAAALRMTPPDVLPRATEHIPEIIGADREAARRRPRLPDRRRLDLLPDRLVAGLRPPGPARSRAAPGRGTGRGRRVRQGRRPRLRPVEGPQARRAAASTRAIGDGPAGLAHRVLGDEHEAPRAVVRHPHRRRST